MTDERATFEQTRARLEEILVQVRKKDTSLEQSLDLLEEGVRLANTCNELIDQTSWKHAAGEDQSDGIAPEDASGGTGGADGGAGGDDPLAGAAPREEAPSEADQDAPIEGDGDAPSGTDAGLQDVADDERS